jgi:hypothetical protein
MADDEPKVPVLDDNQKKAKHDFSIHQDKLAWSRVQYLTVAHAGVLAGLAAFRSDLVVQIGLLVFGMMLTTLVLFLIERDRYFEREALRESGVPPVSKKRMTRSQKLKGRCFNFLAVGLLILAEVSAIVYFQFKPPAPPQPVPVQVEVHVVQPK